MAAKIKTLNVWIELCYDNEADEVPEEILVTVNGRKQKWDDCGSTLMSDEEFITLFPQDDPIEAGWYLQLLKGTL